MKSHKRFYEPGHKACVQHRACERCGADQPSQTCEAIRQSQTCTTLLKGADCVAESKNGRYVVSDLPSLESQLSEMREAAAKRFPPLIDLNRRMVADLESAVIAGALDVGDRAPDFELAEAETDARVKLSDVLAEGPVVLSFYRGHW